MNRRASIDLTSPEHLRLLRARLERLKSKVKLLSAGQIKAWSQKIATMEADVHLEEDDGLAVPLADDIIAILKKAREPLTAAAIVRELKACGRKKHLGEHNYRANVHKELKRCVDGKRIMSKGEGLGRVYWLPASGLKSSPARKSKRSKK